MLFQDQKAAATDTNAAARPKSSKIAAPFKLAVPPNDTSSPEQSSIRRKKFSLSTFPFISAGTEQCVQKI